ncbi:hypothetical protein OAU50_02755 [Planctomycetota bacterium]|nr:hypothetical protein [Planctomycetota bacterium]
MQKWTRKTFERLNEVQLRQMKGWDSTKAIRELVNKFLPGCLSAVDEYRINNPSGWETVKATFKMEVEGLKKREGQ